MTLRPYITGTSNYQEKWSPADISIDRWTFIHVYTGICPRTSNSMWTIYTTRNS